MSLLKVKITPKIKSKLCNHKKVLNCTNIKFYIIIYIKYYPRYVSSPCIHGRDKNTNSQLNGSIKYVSNIRGGVMKNKIYCNNIIINIYFRASVRIFNR